jgi:hypothetical protein
VCASKTSGGCEEIKAEMRGKQWINTAGHEETDSDAEGAVSQALAEFEFSLGEGGSLKAIDYLRLLEALEDSADDQPVETTIRWSEECAFTNDQ